MSIDKISCSKDEFFEILSSVCSELNIKISVKSDSNLQSQYSLLRDSKKSLIRLYVKSDGLKFDTSVGRDRELNFEMYFIHLIETKKPLKSQPSKYGKNVI